MLYTEAALATHLQACLFPPGTLPQPWGQEGGEKPPGLTRHAWLTYSSHAIHPPLVLFLFLPRLLLYALSQFSVTPDSALLHQSTLSQAFPNLSWKPTLNLPPPLHATAISPLLPCIMYSSARSSVLHRGRTKIQTPQPAVLAFLHLALSDLSSPISATVYPWYSSRVGWFTVPTLSLSSLYLYPGSFLAEKVLPLLIFQSPSQSQLFPWFSSIILARCDLLALNSSDPLVFSYFSDTSLVLGKQNRGLLNKSVLNERAAVNWHVRKTILPGKPRAQTHRKSCLGNLNLDKALRENLPF